MPLQALADFAAFINMPNPAFYWQLPVRTWEEVAASRRTNFLGFLQDTSKVRRADTRLGSWPTIHDLLRIRGSVPVCRLNMLLAAV